MAPEAGWERGGRAPPRSADDGTDAETLIVGKSVPATRKQFKDWQSAILAAFESETARMSLARELLRAKDRAVTWEPATHRLGEAA